jgi:retinol dehydrogenase-12
MVDSLDGKTALVTGATNGIGRVTAKELARRGARVLLVARDRDRGETTAAEIREVSGGRAPDLLLADLSSQSEVCRLAQEVRELTPRLDLLVNNAGAIFDERKLSADGLEMTFALNHLAYFLLTLELLPLVEAASGSRIVTCPRWRTQEGRSTSTICKASAPTRCGGRTSSRSWPTCSSRGSWRDACAGAG